MEAENPLVRAARIVGSQKALADAVGLTEQAISKWKRGRVPAERVLAVESATGGKVSRHDLRPDLYPL